MQREIFYINIEWVHGDMFQYNEYSMKYDETVQVSIVLGHTFGLPIQGIRNTQSNITRSKITN